MLQSFSRRVACSAAPALYLVINTLELWWVSRGGAATRASLGGVGEPKRRPTQHTMKLLRLLCLGLFAAQARGAACPLGALGDFFDAVAGVDKSFHRRLPNDPSRWGKYICGVLKLSQSVDVSLYIRRDGQALRARRRAFDQRIRTGPCRRHPCTLPRGGASGRRGRARASSPRATRMVSGLSARRRPCDCEL